MAQGIESYPREAPGFERFVAVVNPNATKRAQQLPYVADLAAYGGLGAPEIIETHQDRRRTFDELAARVRDGDLLVTLSGDGVVNLAANFLGRQEAPNAGLMPTDLGNACNAYHALIDDGYDGQPSRIFKNRREITVFPLRGTVTAHEKYQRLALTVLSVGAIATGAEILDQPRHRNHFLRRHPRTALAYETYVAVCKSLPRLRTLRLDAPFDGADHVLEVVAANAPELAKVAKFDTAIGEHDFVYGIIRSRLPWHLISGMRGLVNGTLPVERIHRCEGSVNMQLAGAPKNKRARIQFDGEVEPLAAGSSLTIDQPGYDDPIHRPIRAITTK